MVGKTEKSSGLLLETATNKTITESTILNVWLKVIQVLLYKVE